MALHTFNAVTRRFRRRFYSLEVRETFAPGTRFDPLVGSVSALIMFAIAFPVSVIAGFLLHLILRMRPMPRILMLPVFLIAGYFSGRIMGARWFATIPLSVAVSFTAWVLYVCGPLRLWDFRFDAGQHSDC
jgi:hypothetical protein